MTNVQDNYLRDVYDTFNPLMEHEWVDFDFGDKRVKIYKNVNISIFLTDYCNACCKFCIEQVEFRNKREMLAEKPRIMTDNMYFRRLDYVLKYVRPLNPSVSITGGEPTLSPRLIAVLKILKKYSFRKITINTNGSGILNVIDGKPIYEHIINYGVTHVNISRHHWEDTSINEVMRFEQQPCTTNMLREAIPILNGKGVRVRVNCVIMKNYIDTLDKIIEFMDYYSSIGVDNFVFRQMMEYNSLYVKNKEIINFYKENLWTIDDIWKYMDNDKRFERVRQIRGRYYYVEIWRYKNIDIVTERASSEVKNKDLGVDESNLVYEMVFHPAGTLTKGWYYKSGVLLNYEE